MAENIKYMDIEEIAKLDFYLKCQSGIANIIDIESLIICENDTQAVNKLKNAAYRLSEANHVLNNQVNDEKQKTWQNLFAKQLKFSVSRAKDKRSK